jgi:hypothetical protein
MSQYWKVSVPNSGKEFRYVIPAYTDPFPALLLLNILIPQALRKKIWIMNVSQIVHDTFENFVSCNKLRELQNQKNISFNF